MRRCRPGRSECYCLTRPAEPALLLSGRHSRSAATDLAESNEPIVQVGDDQLPAAVVCLTARNPPH